MDTILVTGGAGFIGSHVADRLLARGDRVVCIDNFDPYYPPDLKNDNIKDALENRTYRLEEVDIRDKKALNGLFRRYSFSRIIHLAARAGVRPSIIDPSLYQDVNISGTLNLLEVCKESGVQNFIFASSSSVYGNSESIPFREDTKHAMPVSPYAASKLAGEMLCYTYHHLYELPVTCLRFFTVYGPRQRPDMAIPKFIRLIDEGKDVPVFGDGSSRRDYTYITDIVDGIIAALDIPHSYEILNLGNSETVRLQTLIEVIEQYLGKNAVIYHLPDQPGDVPVTCADITRANSLLGYSPRVKINEGIEHAVRWYKAYRHDYSYSY